MKAVVCAELGPPSSLQFWEIPDPTPGPDQVVLEVAAAGLNFPDSLIIEGRYQVQPELPFVPGLEAAGVISELGKEVEGWQLGERVMVWGDYGAFAEKWAVPAKRMHRLPDGFSLELAAGFGLTYATSYHALKQRAELQPGETLLVLGAAGGVGSAAVDLGQAMGAKVIAAVSSAEKEEFCLSLGAQETINYTTDDLKQRIRELTDGRGADVIYDPVGGELTEPALRGIAWNGRLLVVGFAAGGIPRIPLNLPLLKNCAIVGVYWGGWSSVVPDINRQNFVEILALIEQQKCSPQLYAQLPLSEYEQAFAMMSARQIQGKVILAP